MDFAVIDMEGSTVDTFSDASSAAAVLRGLLEHDSQCADDLAVLMYKDGIRDGPPVFAKDFVRRVARSEAAHFETILARSDWNMLLAATVGPATDPSGAPSSSIYIDLSMLRINPAVVVTPANTRSRAREYLVAA